MDERAAEARRAARNPLNTAAFAAALPQGGRLAGLDLGVRTIGVAFCDALWRIATPATTIRRTRLNADLVQLAALFATNEVRGIVLGMPFNMDGTAGPRAQATRAFARDAERAFALPLLLWDERLSSFEAEDAMIAAGVSARDRRERIDAAAAAVILQSALHQLPPFGP